MAGGKEPKVTSVSKNENKEILAALIGVAGAVVAAIVGAYFTGFFGPTKSEAPTVVASPGESSASPVPTHGAVEPADPIPPTPVPSSPEPTPDPTPSPTPTPSSPGAAPPPAASHPSAPAPAPSPAPVRAASPAIRAENLRMHRRDTRSNGNAVTSLTIDVTVENASPQTLKFLALFASRSYTSFTFRNGQKFTARSFSVRTCSLSSAASCKRTYYERFSEVAPEGSMPVSVELSGDIPPALFGDAEGFSSGVLSMRLGVFYDEGEAREVQLAIPGLSVQPFSLQ